MQVKKIVIPILFASLMITLSIIFENVERNRKYPALEAHQPPVAARTVYLK